MVEKIGLAIITYKRFEYFRKVLQSLHENNSGGADEVVIVQDGDFYSDKQWKEVSYLLQDIDSETIILEENMGVATAKNRGLLNLLNKKCAHLFTLEDDILFLSNTVCKEYVQFAKQNDLKHLNFALHGPLNKGKKKLYNGIPVYPDSVGAFSYYHQDIFNSVGFFDEDLVNAWEHVEFTLRISNKKMTTPFWFFADHPNNNKLLREIEGSIENSSISARDDWQENIEKGLEIMEEKYGQFLPPKPEIWSETKIKNEAQLEEKAVSLKLRVKKMLKFFMKYLNRFLKSPSD